MHIDQPDLFSKWLVDELTPITDADPEALAKYVLALVKRPDKSQEELKNYTSELLTVFLQDHTGPFVDTVFLALNSKSYLSAGEAPPPAEKPAEKEKEKEKPAEPTPSEQASTSSNQSKPREDRPARKRISPPPPDREREKERVEKSSRDKPERRNRSRSPVRDRRQRQSGRSGRASSNDRDRYSRRRSRSRSSSRSRSPPSFKQSSRSRRRCRDFEERGYCIRGEQCPYYHGPDPVVVDENALGTIVPLPAAPPNFSFSLPPPGYNPHNPPPPGVVVSAGEYNPETPALTVTNYSVPPPPIPGAWQQVPTAAYTPQPVASFAQPPPAGAPAVLPAPGAPILPSGAPVGFRGGMRGRGAPRGGRGGMGRGGYSGPINRDNCTLQVAKIPFELNNISKLNEHFGAFGTVENIQVRYNGDSEAALVTYASKFDAMKAYKSPAPVLNNRFIKVFWHKPELEGGAPGAEGPGKTSPPPPPKPAEKPKIATVKEAKFVSIAAQTSRKQIQEAKERLAAEKEQLSKLLLLQNEQNILMEKWMTKQKELLVKARASTDEAEKKNTTKLVKVFHKKIKDLKEEIDNILLKISEKSMLVDEFTAQIETLKNPKRDGEESRKRKAGSDGEEEVQTKLSSVIVVKGVKEDLVTELMAHMEAFGEVFDTSVKVDDGLATAVFPYKRAADAVKVMAEGKVLHGEPLDMELKQERIQEIPSTDTNMSADQLLASIPSGLESDEEDDLL